MTFYAFMSRNVVSVIYYNIIKIHFHWNTFSLLGTGIMREASRDYRCRRISAGFARCRLRLLKAFSARKKAHMVEDIC